jgi:hypothetical protein
MSKSDDKLEKELQAMERGVPMDRILAEESASSETISLVNLAAAIRDLPHPKQDNQAVESQRQKITTAAREKSLPNEKTHGKKGGMLTDRWWLIPAFSGLALALLMVFILVAGTGIYFLGPRGAHAATLTDIAGRIQVSSSDESNDWYLVSNGDQVRSGQRIRTGGNSWVTLVFFDGTRTTLAPNTELMLTKIDGGWGNVLQVVLNQRAGQTDHRVVPLRGERAVFNVLTPSGSAYVQGTTFNVLVDETGKSMFKVDTGKVLVTNDVAEAFVEAGQGLMTQTGKPLANPNYLFVLQGEVNSKAGKTWTVAGVTLSVHEGTQEIGDTSVGRNVLVEGRIKGNYEWVADSVHQALTDDQLGAFTGVVNSIDGDNWQVNGIDFTVDDQTDKDDEITAGDIVRVAFRVFNSGDWKILSIESLEGEPDDPNPPPTPDPDAHPKLSFEPDELQQTACLPEYTLTGTLVNKAEEADDVAVNVLLGFEIIKGGKYVEEVILDPIGWEEILPDGSEEFEVKVSMDLDEDKWESTPSGTEVRIRVYIAEETNWPDQPSSLTVTIISDCEGEPPDDGDEDEEDTPPDDSGDTCTGTDQHPKALKILDYYEEYYPDFAAYIDLKYDNIMGWFCDDRLGFGEIELMLGLSLKYDVSVDEIRGMRVDEDMGWGQIKKELATQAEDQQDKGRPFKPEPPGKKKAEENKNKNKPGKKDDD